MRELFKANLVPEQKKQEISRPIIEFFKGMPPLWGDIMSNNIHRTSYFKQILDSLYNPLKNTIIIGSPLSGKTTLMKQVAYHVEGFETKLLFEDLTVTKADYILKLLGEDKALIFIEAFTDDVEAFLRLSEAPNVSLVGVDRSHNFEIVSNCFSPQHFQIINVTELSDMDVQGVFNSLPIEVKKSELKRENNSKYKSDTIYEFVLRNIKGETIKTRYLNAFYELKDKNRNLALFLSLCAYMHYCRVPLSMEVAFSFFDDCSYKDVYVMKDQLNDLLNDFEDDSLEQNLDYYYPRSYYFAETIIDASARSKILADVITGVVEKVSPVQICNYHKFKKYAFDKELFLKAFRDWNEGMELYKKAYLYDYKNPYVLQQGALYLSAKKQFKLAFDWIDRAITKTNNKYFSIRNSHAIILFEANYEVSVSAESEEMLDTSMEILHKCYQDDQRKTFHALTYADQAIRYFKKTNSEKTRGYLQDAKEWLKEELNEKKWNFDVKRKLYELDNLMARL